jgi:predicted O-linked N-acetylglucosamine transferase (SPINDLY family)
MHVPTFRPAPAAVGNPEAERHWRGGLEHARAGRWKDAERAYARAVRAAPGEALFRVNLGQARRKLGDLEGACAAADEALRVAPGDPLATQLRLATRLERHRFADALEDAERTAHQPQAGAPQWTDYAVALYHVDRNVDAASALLQALGREPDFFPAHVLLCNVFDRLGLNAEAVECLRTAVALRPGWGAGLSGIVYHSLAACDWTKLDADLQALHAVLERPDPLDFGPFMFLSSGADAATQRRVFADYTKLFYGNLAPLPPIEPAACARTQRLRVGYLSNDFHQHATALLVAQVFELHDRSRFDVRLYSYGKGDGTPMRRRLESAGDAFVDIAGLSDLEAAQRIRDDGIDVLVDLKGHTLNARTAIMALRPAPVQVAWLGFPGTMGAGFIDYAVTDPVVTPPALADGFSEKLAWMPDCYQPNDRLRAVDAPPGRAACGLPEHGFVFCCFNQTYKVRPGLFDVWCRLLAATPGSVLWLLQSNPQAVDNIRREARHRGIDPGRIVFAPLVPSHANLARLTHADLFLDTLPVNAHTTASDALWSGVPLVTCPGDTFAARVAASLLHAVGLPELVVPDMAAYEATARAIAADPQRLAELKARLRAARDTAPLFDSARTTRALEDLFLRMAERWRAGLPPDHLEPRPAVAPDHPASRPAAEPDHPVPRPAAPPGDACVP